MIGVYLFIAALSIIIMTLFVDKVKVNNYQRPEKCLEHKNGLINIESTARSQTIILLMATIKHLRNKKQLLLIPFTIYGGIKDTFLFAEYSLVIN